MISKKNKNAERNLERVLGKQNSEHFLKSTPMELNQLVHKNEKSKSKANSRTNRSIDKSKSLYSNFTFNATKSKKKFRTTNFLLRNSHNSVRGINLCYDKNFDKK